MKSFPTLYKLSTKGKLLQWDICVLDSFEDTAPSIIVTRHGQVGGKIQEASDTITEGKNIGKVNETTPYEQACSEAESKWRKQLDKGYIDCEDKAKAGISHRPVKPMLAHKYRDHSHKIKWPALGQTKLNGVRCTAKVNLDTGVVELFTRNGKPITSMVHIVKKLSEMPLFPNKSVSMTFDGELYKHGMPLEEIVSAVRKEKPSEGSDKIEYHIYDIVDTNKTQRERIDLLEAIFDNLESFVLIKVPSKMLYSKEEATDMFNSVLQEDQSYEGLILRNLDAKYEEKRSYNLQKYKPSETEEFDIVGIEEGRGKLKGHGIFVCKTDNGDTFSCKLEGSLDYLKQLWDNHDLWKGKKLTVEFANWTKYNLPKDPVGKAIRDYE